jgi:hypothetical protein
MSKLIHVLLACCLAFAVILAPARGDGGSGLGGEGNGWGNLPGGIKFGAGIGGLDGSDGGAPRLTLRFADLEDGLKLRLAPEMKGAMVAVTAPGHGTVWLAASGRDIVLAGAALAVLRQAGIASLALLIVAADGSFLCADLLLEADASATLIVR